MPYLREYRLRPAYGDVPERYHELLDWYDADYSAQLKVLGEDFLNLEPGDSGLTDVSERHDYYLDLAWDERPTLR